MACHLLAVMRLTLVWASLVQVESWVQVFRVDELWQGLKNGGTAILTAYRSEKVLKANLTAQRGEVDFSHALLHAVARANTARPAS
jgi:hypothetical protein